MACVTLLKQHHLHSASLKLPGEAYNCLQLMPQDTNKQHLLQIIMKQNWVMHLTRCVIAHAVHLK